MRKFLWALLLAPSVAFAQYGPGAPPVGTTAGTVAGGDALSAETSRATAAESLKAPLASPTFTGTVNLGGSLTLGPAGSGSGTIATNGSNHLFINLSTDGQSIFRVNTGAGATPLLDVGGNPNGIQSYVPLHLAPATAWSSIGTTSGFWMNKSFTGTSSAATFYNLLQVTDNVADSSVQGSSVLNVNQIIGGSSSSGTKNAFISGLSMTSASGNTTGVGGSYSSGQFTSFSNVNDNGTFGAEKGLLYGINPVAHLGPSATRWNSLITDEHDISADSGSSVLIKLGMQIVALSTDAVQGSLDDAGLSFNNQYAQGSGAGWKYGIMFGRNGGFFPMVSTGTLIGAATQSGTKYVAHGIDWSSVTFSSDALKTPGFVVDGSGNITAPQLTGNVVGTATNVTGTVAIANGGTGATTGPTGLVALGGATATALATENTRAAAAETAETARATAAEALLVPLTRQPAIVVTDAAYAGGAVPDKREGFYAATWSQNAGGLTIGSLTSTMTVSGTSTSITELANNTGVAFQKSDVGLTLAVSGVTWGGGKSSTTIAAWVSGSQVTTADAADQTVTAASATATWPVFVASDAGKSIYVSNGAATLGSVGFLAGAPLVTTIASVTSPTQVTLSANLTAGGRTAWQGTRVVWGTDNSAAIVAAAAAGPNRRVLNFPPGGYAAFAMGTAAMADAEANHFWIGDDATGFFVEAGGVLARKRIVPRTAPAPPAPPPGVFGGASLPRVASVAAPCVAVWGDSMGTEQPQLQGGAWSPWAIVSRALQDANPGKSFTLVNRAIGGAVIQWLDAIPPGPTWPSWYAVHTNTWESYVKTSCPGGGTPDLVLLEQSGGNEGAAISLPAYLSVFRKIKAWPTTNGLPPDVIMANNRGQSSVGVPGEATQAAWEGASTAIRSLARGLGAGLLDYSDRALLVKYGSSPLHNAMRTLPSVSGTTTGPGSPRTLQYAARDFRAKWYMAGQSTAAGAWSAISNGANTAGTVQVQISPRVDNVFVFGQDASSNLTVQVNAYGGTTATPADLSAGSAALTTSGQTTVTGTVTLSNTVAGGQYGSTLTVTGASFAASDVGKSIVVPGAYYAGGGATAPFRSQIVAYVSATQVVLADQAPVPLTAVASTTVTYGGMLFVPTDATGQADITIAGAGASGGLLTTKVAAYTDATHVTLAANAGTTVAAGTPVNVFLGRIAVPLTATGIPAASDAGTANPAFSIELRGTTLFATYQNSVDTYTAYRGRVERGLGGPFVPVIGTPQAAANGTNVSVYGQEADMHISYMPALTDTEMWGVNDAQADALLGGQGVNHLSSAQAALIDEPVLAAQNLTAR